MWPWRWKHEGVHFKSHLVDTQLFRLMQIKLG